MSDAVEDPAGSVTVHPSVVVTVARLTALATPGVARLGHSTRGRRMRRMLAPPGGDGVDLRMCDGALAVDLHVVAEAEANLVRLGQALQTEVQRAIRELVGMEVREVNVTIQDVDIPLARAT